MTTWTPITPDPWIGRPDLRFTRDDIRPTTETLDEIIGLDSGPVEVRADGTIVSRHDLYTPDVYAEVDAEGSYTPTAERDAASALEREGWEPMRGYTGQWGALVSNWFMHASEFIGGRLAADILASPGVYVAVVIYPDGPGEDTDVEPTEWAVIRRTA